MRTIVKVMASIVFAFGTANAETMQEWCQKNQRQCDAAINTCEADENLDCDAYMNKIKSGDVSDLGKKKPPR